jgi:hypothetical protein
MGKIFHNFLFSFYQRFLSERAERRNEENLWRIPNFILLILTPHCWISLREDITHYSAARQHVKSRAKMCVFTSWFIFFRRLERHSSCMKGANEEEAHMPERECFSKVNVTSFIYSSIKIISITHLWAMCYFTLLLCDIHASKILLNSIFLFCWHLFFFVSRRRDDKISLTPEEYQVPMLWKFARWCGK